MKEYFARWRELSNCTILTMSPPIYAIGEMKPEKKFRASTRLEPVTSTNTSVMLYQLSYEVTYWEPGHFLWVLSFFTNDTASNADYIVSYIGIAAKVTINIVK